MSNLKFENRLHRAVIAALNASDEFGTAPVLSQIQNFIDSKTINYQNDEGKTALHIACASRNPFKMHIVKLLRDVGASVDILDQEGKTPLDYIEH